MENQKDWDNSHFTDYLLYDLWPPVKAWALLAGFDWFEDVDSMPEFISFFNEGEEGYEGDVRTHVEEKRIYRRKKENLRRLRNFWVSGEKGEDSQTPKYFIDWALSKRFRPDWLDWAIEQGLYISKENREQKVNSAPNEIENLPIELDYALKAWRAASTDDSNKKPKAKIRAWLDSNAKELSNQAKDRISIVANWEKLGGATRTD